MKLKSTSYALLGASLLVLAACGDDNNSRTRTQVQYPATPSSTNPSATSPDTDAPFAAFEMLPECDTRNNDTSQMTAKERQTFADKCEAAKRRSPTRYPESPPDLVPPQ